MPKLYSGGADGADYVWAECAISVGWDVINIVVSSSQVKLPSSRYYKLSEKQFKKGWAKILEINKSLRRGDPNVYKPYVKKLLARNVYIVDAVDAVFSVGYLDDGFQHVLGGTGWGVEQAVLYQKPVYVFDQRYEMWYTHNGTLFIPAETPKLRYKSIAGVGSRKLTDVARNEIINLFKDETS